MVKKAAVPVLICLILLFFLGYMKVQTVIPLYDGKIPNARPYKNQEKFEYQNGILIIHRVSVPTLTILLPPKERSTGAAVIICPGGSYSILAASHEGTDVARRFVESGITAFVLKYRIPDDSTMINKETGPIEDAQRAILVVRSRAAEWGIDPDRIGIMGFSAGGHLASTAGTHFNREYISNPEHISLRPDFLILVYPVISFDPRIAHMGSVHNLLGLSPALEKLKEYSNEMQVTDQTPPAFLVHAKDDSSVSYANSVEFADSLKKHHIPVQVFLYEQGGHGFGMNNQTSSRHWMDACIQWMDGMNILKPKNHPAR
jgi:acetyl esterase/lipase